VPGLRADPGPIRPAARFRPNGSAPPFGGRAAEAIGASGGIGRLRKVPSGEPASRSAGVSGCSGRPGGNGSGGPSSGRTCQNRARPGEGRVLSGLDVGSISVHHSRREAAPPPGGGGSRAVWHVPHFPATVPLYPAQHIPGYRIVGLPPVVAAAAPDGGESSIVSVPEAETTLDPAIAARLKRTPDGLVAAIVQEHDTGDVLMLAWMDDEALRRTLTTGRATYWSRSRGEYWVKGATSGHHQHVRKVSLDCDGDALLVTVDQTGAACHTGTHTCFTDDLLEGQ